VVIAGHAYSLIGVSGREEAPCRLIEFTECPTPPIRRDAVNPTKHPSVKRDLGQQFIDWLISAEGQNAIAGYKINGQQLFYPSANDPST
jgi:hypothetical protein